MRKILLPINNEENEIKVSQITRDFKGFVFVKLNEEIKGIILYNKCGDYWNMLTTLHNHNSFATGNSLYQLIKKLSIINPEYSFFTT